MRLTSLLVLLAAWAGCAPAVSPPATPAGVVLPPEVEFSAEEAAAKERPTTPDADQRPAGYR